MYLILRNVCVCIYVCIYIYIYIHIYKITILYRILTFVYIFNSLCAFNKGKLVLSNDDTLVHLFIYIYLLSHPRSHFICVCICESVYVYIIYFIYIYMKESACNGDLGSIPGSGRSSGEGRIFYPLHYSCLENSMDRGAWQATVHGVTKNRVQLSN